MLAGAGDRCVPGVALLVASCTATKQTDVIIAKLDLGRNAPATEGDCVTAQSVRLQSGFPCFRQPPNVARGTGCSVSRGLGGRPRRFSVVHSIWADMQGISRSPTNR